MSSVQPALSRRKRIVFSLILLAFVWLILDTGAYLALRVVSTRLGIFYGLKPPTDAELAAFTKAGFDPVLGWDLRPSVAHGPLGEKQGHPYTPQARYKVKAFGDSFTEGVREPSNSFEYAVEEQTGWTCLNFGVSGYGPDQALLKYQRSTVPSEYTLLGILDENIGRSVNSLRGFYTLEESFRAKPRFVRQPDGRIVLVPNPIHSAADLVKLKDPAFVEGLRRYDYWTQYYESLNAPRELRWPATLTILPHLNFFVRQGSQLLRSTVRPTYESALWRSRYYHLYEPGSTGIAVLDHIVDEFITTAHDRGETPVVLVFAARETMDIMRQFGRKPYQTLVDHLKERQVAFIDYGDLFVNEPDLPQWYVPNDGHFNAIGNRHVAEAIVRTIRMLDAGKTPRS